MSDTNYKCKCLDEACVYCGGSFTVMFCNMRGDTPINIHPRKTEYKTHKIIFKAMEEIR